MNPEQKNENKDGTFILDTLGYIECCDCSLVHSVTHFIRDSVRYIHFERMVGRTKIARITKKDEPKKEMSPVERLAYAIANDDLHPEQYSGKYHQYKSVKVPVRIGSVIRLPKGLKK